MARRARGERAPLPAGFGVIWTTVAIDLVGFGIVAPILPQYAERFGMSATAIGFLFASFSLAQLVFAPLWGRVSDRIGRKPVILISLFGTAAGSLLTGVAGSVVLLFAGRLIDGASGASVSVAQAAVGDVAEPRDRARLMGLLGAAFGVGFVAGPAIGALGGLGGAHVPFLIAAAISFVNGLVALRRLPETHPRPHPSRPSGVSAPLVRAERELSVGETREEPTLGIDGPGLDESAQLGPPPGSGDRLRRVILRLIMVAFVAMIAFSGFEATFALLAEDRLGLHLSSTAAVFTVIGLGLVAVQGGIVGPVTHRLGETSTLRFGLVSNALGLALLAVDGGWLLLVPALALLVLGQGLLSPTLSSAVAGRAGGQRGAWLGWQQSAGGLARVLGPVLAGALYQHVGSGAPYAVGAVLVVVALILVPMTSRIVVRPA